MQEQVVTFETAKLAKEKDFSKPITKLWGNHYYNYKGELDGDCLEQIKEFILSKKENREVDAKYGNIEAPTQSLLQKWLREQYRLHITINVGLPHNCPIMYYSNVIKFGMHHKSKFKSKFFNTYEEALEVGLQEALKLI